MLNISSENPTKCRARFIAYIDTSLNMDFFWNFFILNYFYNICYSSKPTEVRNHTVKWALHGWHFYTVQKRDQDFWAIKMATNQIRPSWHHGSMYMRKYSTLILDKKISTRIFGYLNQRSTHTHRANGLKGIIYN